METLKSIPETCDILRVHPTTLWRFRLQGGGPRFIRVGRRIFYRLSAIEQWLESETYSHSSEVDAIKSQAQSREQAKASIERVRQS
jgi:predicted DNA-binding transcriptional regulator AlpA